MGPHRRSVLLVAAAVSLAGALAAAPLAVAGTDQSPGTAAERALGDQVVHHSLPLRKQGSTLHLAYCGNGSATVGNPAVRTVVIAVHGSSRNGCDYARHAADSAAAAGVLASTLVVAPTFPVAADLQRANTRTLYWSDDGWKSGNRSLRRPLPRPWSISSYAAVDRLVAALVRPGRFPSLTRVVVAGHSAGGQFVNRYSVGSPTPRSLGVVEMRYVVMNPSSYVYLSDRRFDGQAFRTLTPAETERCSGYNTYKYGLRGRNAYMARTRVSVLVHRFATRDVTYLLGADDTDPADPTLDTGCQAEWQGSQRRERGTTYLDSLVDSLGAGVTDYQHVAAVPGVAHSGTDLFVSAEGQRALFGR